MPTIASSEEATPENKSERMRNNHGMVEPNSSDDECQITVTVPGRMYKEWCSGNRRNAKRMVGPSVALREGR